MQIHGEVPEGQAVLTGAGNLPCKNIIHAVGPHWKGGGFGEADTLYDCIFSHVLEIADREIFTSIAIPAVSSGVFGLPLTVSTSAIVEAITDFLNGKNGVKMTGNLSEICLVDKKQETVQEFAAALRRCFKQSQNPTKPAKPPKPTNSTGSTGKTFY